MLLADHLDGYDRRLTLDLRFELDKACIPHPAMLPPPAPVKAPEVGTAEIPAELVRISLRY